jgi:hypothetical protein
MAKRLYMMNPQEYSLFTECCNPPKLLVVTNGNTPAFNRFLKAEQFWQALGGLHDFDWATVEPCEGMHVAFFRAEPVERP